MRACKGPKTIAVIKKPASGKLLSTSTKLDQDELLPGFSEAKSLEDSSNKNDNDVRLLLIKVGKGPRIIAANGKPSSEKLLSASTNLALEIGQDIRAKKILILKTG